MTFKKPFRAVPINPGPRYQQIVEQRTQPGRIPLRIAVTGLLAGIALGLALLWLV